MFSHHFKIMLRSLWKNKAFSLINLFGLATGMAVCLLLALYIRQEVGYDDFHERGDQVYRLAFERKYPSRSAFKGQIPQSIGQAVKEEFPEVMESTRVLNVDVNGAKVTAGEKVFTEKFVLIVDPNFFRVFTGRFLQGDANTALQKPGTVVLNESTAKKYFGSAEHAMGKALMMDGSRTCIVDGVCSDWPEKSHLKFDVLMASAGMNWLNSPEYVYFGPYTYLLLKEHASPAALQAKLPLIVDKYVAPVIPKLFGESYEQFKTEGNGYAYFLQPLKDIHLHSTLEDELLPAGSMRAIVLLGIIAVFILLLACANFINLSTALAVERAREVGVRKTFGSGKSALVRQFLTESTLFSFVSVVAALLCTALFTPLLNQVSENHLRFTYFLQPLPLLVITGFSFVVGMMAGLYPAFVLSSFDPIEVLKGRFKSGRRGIALRNGMVVFQFTISVILIICTIVVNKQMRYMLSNQLGFKQDHIISIDGMWRLRSLQTGDSRQAFVDDVLKIAGVINVTKCSALPGDDESGGGSTWVAVENNASRTQRIIQADEKYLKMLDLQLRQGRFFSKDLSTDSLSVILNEQAAADFGLQNPIGAKLISKESDYNPGDGKDQYVFTVIGVVKDFHYQSLRKKIAPLIIANANKFGWGSAGVLVDGNHFKTTIAEIQQTWSRFEPKEDLQFRFLDQNLAAQYKAEQTQQKIFTIFSVLAILIGCVGLFGLSAYATRQRLKEISIRKVLGALPGNIFIILSRDFLRLIIIASLIAFPLGWWAMHAWLQNFAYRVAISWWVFALAGAFAILIAVLTIGYQTIKVAIANPVKHLKAE